MSELASLTAVRNEEHTTLVLEGEVDASNAEALLRRMQGLLDAPTVTLDLAGVGYLDSAGIRALYGLAESAALRGASISVVVPRHSPIRRVLDVSGVRAVLTVDET